MNQKIAIYNPRRLSADEVKAFYIARETVLNQLLQDIDATRDGAIPQHHLIVGQRGMGKTMLLRRLEVALREVPLATRFIPLGFPEEQYMVDRLSKFWLNCLDALADALEHEQNATTLVAKIDQAVEQLGREESREEVLAEAAEKCFLGLVKELGRRPVLLVDNLDLVFERLKKHEHNRLRAFLMLGESPIVVGACVTPPSATADYDAPFFDHFKTCYLDRLSEEEMRAVLVEMAKRQGNTQLVERLDSERVRLKVLHKLTGGNPRTTVMLFEIFAKGFSPEVYQDLETLLDWVTPLYKARFEELPPQAQVVVGALAVHWEPATSGKLGELTRLENNQISPQIDRLRKQGIIEEVPVDPEDRVGPITETSPARTGYQLSERFFNIWFLMRQATRRDRSSLVFLTRFLECMLTAEERCEMALRLLTKPELCRAERHFGLALESAIPQRELRDQLHECLQWEALRAMHERLEGVLDPIETTDIPAHKINLMDLREKIKQAVPANVSFSKDQFADQILGAPDLMRWRSAIAGQKLDEAKANAAYRDAVENIQSLEKQFGAEDARWFITLLQRGTITNFADEGQMSVGFDRAETAGQAKLMVLHYVSSAKKRIEPKLQPKLRSLLVPNNHSPIDDWRAWGQFLLFASNELPETERAFRKIIELDATDATAWSVLGYALNGLGRYKEAEEMCRKAIQLDEKNVFAWRYMGVAFNMLGRYAESVEACRKAIELGDSGDAQAWINLGHGLLNIQRFEEAIEACRKAIELDKNAANAWNILAQSLNSLNRYTEAEEVCRKAINYNDKHVSFRCSLALTLNNLKRYAEAEVICREAINLDGKNPAVWGIFGLTLNNLKRYAEAEKASRKAIELDPKYLFAWKQLGLALTNLKHYVEAREVWCKLVGLDAKDVYSWSLLGLVSNNLKQYKDAQKAYQKGIELDPNSDVLLNSFGLFLCDAMGRTEEAVEFLSKAAAVDSIPGVFAKLNLVFILRDYLNRIDEARQELAGIHPKDDKDVQATVCLHHSLFAGYAGDWSGAAVELGKGLDLLGDSAAFPLNTQDDWLRSTAVWLHLGCGGQLLEFLAARGEQQRRQPWYEAIRAHLRGSRLYLRNIPEEMREAANQLYDDIERYLQRLPEATRRWSPPSVSKRARK